jgi:hypothetical protein
MSAYSDSVFDPGFFEPDPVFIKKKYGNGNGRGVFLSISICFHPYLGLEHITVSSWALLGHGQSFLYRPKFTKISKIFFLSVGSNKIRYRPKLSGFSCSHVDGPNPHARRSSSAYRSSQPIKILEIELLSQLFHRIGHIHAHGGTAAIATIPHS